MSAGPGVFRRVYLTLRYEGPRVLARRVIDFPRRLTPEARRLRLGRQLVERRLAARQWYARHRRPVARADVDGADLVVLAPGTRGEQYWLECLQWAAYVASDRVGVVTAQMIEDGGVIGGAGLHRDRAQPDRFLPTYGGRPIGFGPAQVPHPVIAVGGDCMYVKRELIDRIGPPDASTTYSAVEYCLRAWSEGYEVVYEPAAIVAASRDVPNPGDAGPFWAQWHEFFDDRPVHAAGDRLRIIYVTEGTGLWGGHRLVFQDLNELSARGHEVALFTLEPPPGWFDLEVPVRTFPSYADLTAALAPLQAIKVATWWRTATPVWKASIVHGRPVYLVQDIESSYYPESEAAGDAVLASYRNEFDYVTTSTWNRDRLGELGHDACLIEPAIDHATFRPIPHGSRERAILALARSDRLKRFDLTVAAWRALPEPRPELWVFGSEPDLAPRGSRYFASPSDGTVNDLLNRCGVFVQTSSHEGFALPPLEAMAAGAPVVCTDAHGNRDYCVDGVNCLMPAAEPELIADAISSLLDDPSLCARLGAAGIETARRYGREPRIDALERFLREVARGARPPAAPRG